MDYHVFGREGAQSEERVREHWMFGVVEHKKHP